MIHMVSEGFDASQYPLNQYGGANAIQLIGMAIPSDAWKLWGQRIRVHCKEKGLRPIAVASRLGMSEPALRSWLNGNREINLIDFFRLCAAVKADPQQILFVNIGLTSEQRKAIGERVVTILESDPATNPDYPKMVRSLQADIRHKRSK